MTDPRFLQTRRRIVPAEPHDVFDLLADPAMHPVIDGSGTVRATRGDAPERLRLGSEFGMDMRLGVRYRISNTVVEFEQDRLIAWRHFSGHRWRYELQPTDGGTLVSETWDASRLRHKWVLVLMGFTRSTGPNMERTLERLAGHFTGSADTANPGGRPNPDGPDNPDGGPNPDGPDNPDGGPNPDGPDNPDRLDGAGDAGARGMDG